MADPIVIGASLPKTGPYAETQFLQYQRAYDQWVADQNAAGGIMGRPIEFKWYDDFGKGENAGENYRRLIDEDKVDLLLGPCHSVIIEPMVHVTEERKRVLLEGSGSVSEMFRKGRKYLFLVWGADCDYMESFLEMMSAPGNSRRVSKVGMIYGNRPRGLGHAQGVRDHAARLGLQVAFDGKIGEEPDYAAVGRQAAALGAEILLWDMEARGAAKKAAIQAVCDAGFSPSQLWLSEQPNPAGSEVDGLFSRVTWAPNHPSPKSLKFYSDFKRLWNFEPEYHSAGGYACGEVLAQAVEKAGSLDNEKLRSTILSSEFDTVMGKLRFAENGLPIATFPVAQWQNGVPELVYPASAKTKEPLFI